MWLSCRPQMRKDYSWLWGLALVFGGLALGFGLAALVWFGLGAVLL